MAIKGIKASRKLLEGAKHTATHGYTREYQKAGGVHEAFQDFMSLGMHEARSFRSWDGVMYLVIDLKGFLKSFFEILQLFVLLFPFAESNKNHKKLQLNVF